MKNLSSFFLKHIDDLLIFMGFVTLTYATYRLSWIAALYLTGGALIFIGALIGISQKGDKP